MAALLALASAVCFGASDYLGGVATRRASALVVVAGSNGLSLLLGVLLLGLPGSTAHAADLAWGFAAGAVGLVGVLLLYRGLAIGPMSVVAPLTAVLAALLPAAVGVLRGDRPSAPALAGIVLAVPAIVLISRERPPATASPGASRVRVAPAAVVAALAAGLSFGGFYVLFAQTGPDGGVWPLVAQRSATVGLLAAVLGGLALAGAGPRLPPRRLAWPIAGAGLTDLAANFAYIQATHRGLLALVAVISSLYPATTVLMARVLLDERLHRLQASGLGLAAVAVALIALR